MSGPTPRLVLGALTLLAACGDPGSFGTGQVRDAGADGLAPSLDATADGPPPQADALPPDPPPDGPDAAPSAPAQTPAFVQLTLDPVQTLYLLSDTPTVRAEVFDTFGDPIPEAPLSWSIVPAGSGRVDPSGLSATVSFLASGPGAVRACATPDLCGRATYFVDDGPPVLTLLHPEPGEVIAGRPVVTVSGSATGTDVAVFVNDIPVELGPDGAFSVELPARFGFNRVDVVADDGVQRPPVREVREALYAPRFLAPGASGIELGDAVALRLHQRLLDTGAAVPAPSPEDPDQTILPDLATLLEALLARVDPLSLLDAPVLAEGEPLDLTVTEVTPGTPDVTLLFTETGLEVFLRLSDLGISTRGRLTLEGVPVDLGGTITVSAAAYAQVALQAGPGGAPVLALEGVDVALERLSGRMDDSTAQAVLDTFGSLLRGVLEDFARRTVDDLVQTRVPDFIELGLGDVLATLDDLSIDVAADGVVPAVQLRAGFRLARPTLVPRGHLTLTLSGSIRQPAPIAAPHPDPGLADESTDATEAEGPPWPAAAGAAVAIRLRTVNALLHEVWRQGSLRIDATPVIPENLRALVSAVRIDARLPPLVVAAPPGAPHLFELQVGELDLVAQGPRTPAPDEYTVSLRLGLALTVDATGLHFDIAGAPDTRVALRRAGGDRPFLSADALAGLLTNLLQTELRKALENGLHVDLPAAVLDGSTLDAIAADVESVTILPTFPEAPRVRHGWFVLGAGLSAALR
ncbi:hypothetical protein L6V77_04425 [Myxococcota bacterium]|nr:hypothetical protein [Myxococcota bacterium]